MDYEMTLRRTEPFVETQAVHPHCVRGTLHLPGLARVPGHTRAAMLCTLEDLPVLALLTLRIAWRVDTGQSLAANPNSALYYTPAKTPGKTAIPAGKYRVVLSYSARFRQVLPELLDVEQFTAIRCHGGNTAKDTEGCVLVGMEAPVRSPWLVRNCAPAVLLLCARIAGAQRNAKVYVNVQNAFTVPEWKV